VYVCVCACARVRVHVRLCVRACVYAHIICARACQTRACVYAFVRNVSCVHACMRTHTCVRAWTRVCVARARCVCACCPTAALDPRTKGMFMSIPEHPKACPLCAPCTPPRPGSKLPSMMRRGRGSVAVARYATW